MELIALGTAAGGVPRAGDAGSGYLVRDGETSILLDLGGGVLGNLSRHIPFEEVDALFFSHLHFDHCLDIFPMLLVRSGHAPLPVFGPPGTEKILSAFFPLFSSKPQLYTRSMEVTEYAEGTSNEVGTLRVTPFAVAHDLPSYALRIQGSGLVAYSSDSAPCEGLERAAQGVDLFLCEATFQSGMAREKGRDQHLDSSEAGEIAKRAGAKRLLLTHIRYDLDPAVSAQEASEAFGGPAEAAVPNQVYPV